MTRFLYIADTHLGAVQGQGYCQQPRYAQRLPALLDALTRWMEARPELEISFVLHGGDMVDSVDPGALRQAGEVFRLPVPVCLSLGNHDLTSRDAVELWRTVVPCLFPQGRLAFTLECDGWMVHSVPTQWCDEHYYWEEAQQPHLSVEDLAWLEAALAAHPDMAHLVCTHGAFVGVPTAQTGFDTAYHVPPVAWTATLLRLIRCYPQLKVVFGGHTHINSHVRITQAHLVTASAFVETPFEFKLVEVTPERFTLETVSLLP